MLKKNRSLVRKKKNEAAGWLRKLILLPDVLFALGRFMMIVG
jgi:hypothetical protein